MAPPPSFPLDDRPSDDRSGSPEDDVSSEAGRRMAEVLRGGLRVALFLDYDGTLREIEPDPAAAAPTPAVRELLDALAADARLDVTIVSGRTPRDLDAFVGGYPFGMIAEHGASVRPPRSRAWEHLGDAAGDATGDAWRAEVLALMRARVESTPGSFVE